MDTEAQSEQHAWSANKSLASSSGLTSRSWCIAQPPCLSWPTVFCNMDQYLIDQYSSQMKKGPSFWGHQPFMSPAVLEQGSLSII